ncbi:MAG: HK97-gp10 family putative phage morphogenesis protein [Mycobacterium sp.]
MRINVRGLKALDRKLVAISKAAAKAEDEALGVGAEMVADEARLRAPHRSGALRASLTHSRGKDKKGWRAGTNLFYGKFLEFGTVNAPERPYLFPAFESLRKRIVEDIVRARVKASIVGALR